MAKDEYGTDDELTELFEARLILTDLLEEQLNVALSRDPNHPIAISIKNLLNEDERRRFEGSRVNLLKMKNSEAIKPGFRKPRK